MEVLISVGIYLLICAGLIGLAIGGVYLKKKFNIKDSEIELASKVINLIVYLANKGNFKFSGDIKLVANYVLQAIAYVDKIEDAMTLDEKKIIIQDEAIELCRSNGIKIDTELTALINEIVDYFI